MRTIRSRTVALTATKEDYVRAIYILSGTKNDTSVTQIAARLKLSKSTVSERVKELVRDGLVTAEPYAPVSLTKKGEEIGKKLTYKHRLIEVFLHGTLKVPMDKIHAEAERLEHAMSDDVIQRLAHFLDYPENDPHGSALPKITHWNK